MKNNNLEIKIGNTTFTVELKTLKFQRLRQ